VPNICAIRSTLETGKGCAAAKEINASQASGVRRDSVALAETGRGSASVILSRELVEVGLAGALRQLGVDGVEDLTHCDGVAARGGGVEAAPGDPGHFEDEGRRARRDGGLVQRVGVAGRVEARRRRGLDHVEAQLRWSLAGVRQ